MQACKVVEAASGMITKLLFDSVADIHAAYLKADGGLAISLALKISPTKDMKQTDVEVTINFVESRIKKSLDRLVVDVQPDLFLRDLQEDGTKNETSGPQI